MPSEPKIVSTGKRRMCNFHWFRTQLRAVNRVGGSVRLRIRDFEQRGETYEGCFLDTNGELVLLTRVGNSLQGTVEAREVPFGKLAPS